MFMSIAELHSAVIERHSLFRRKANLSDVEFETAMPLVSISEDDDEFRKFLRRKLASMDEYVLQEKIDDTARFMGFLAVQMEKAGGFDAEAIETMKQSAALLRESIKANELDDYVGHRNWNKYLKESVNSETIFLVAESEAQTRRNVSR